MNEQQLAARLTKVTQERDELEGKLSAYLCDNTGGLLSKTTYSVRDMSQATEEYYDRLHRENNYSEESAKHDMIRGLHYPVDIEPSDTICHECSHQLPSGDYGVKVVEYPCATLQVLDPEEV